MSILRSSTNDSLHSKVNHRRRLALLLLGSFFATQAAQHPRHFIHRNFRRLFPQWQQKYQAYEYEYGVDEPVAQIGDEETVARARTTTGTCSVSSAVQSLVERALAEEQDAVAALSCRGGYKDEVAVETDADAVAVVVEKTAEPSSTERIDLEAKATEYGELEFSLFQKGDGSDEDPEGIPDRYLRMQLHHREKAKKACQLTLEWRKEHGIDHILRDPHPDFDICKAVFPHYFTSRDKDGHIVFVQRPALMNLDLAHKNGLDKEHLLST